MAMLGLLLFQFCRLFSFSTLFFKSVVLLSCLVDHKATRTIKIIKGLVPMSLIFITDDFAVDPSQISSLESYERWHSDPDPCGEDSFEYSGVLVVQKNGHNTRLKNLTVKEVHEKIRLLIKLGEP